MKLHRPFQSLGIRARVPILAVIPVASVAGLLGYNLASSRLDDAQRNLAERGELIARNLALASEFGLFSQNLPLVDETLQRIAREPDVKWSVIWDAQRGTVISRGTDPEAGRLRGLVDAMQRGQPLPPGYHFAAIRVGGVDITDFREEYLPLGAGVEGPPSQLLGFAVIQLTPDGIMARRAAIRRDSALVTLSGLALSVLLALLIGNSITDPVLRLLAAVRALQAGRLDARVRARAGGEIGSLERGVNRMAEALQHSQQTLQRRVDEATAALRRTVAELEARNRELDHAREVALRAGRERTEFLARMSHEIRTPLHAVVGFAKLLQAGGMSEADAEHVRTIQTAAQQLLRVIDDILQFVRLDAGAEQLESLPFSLADVLEDVVAMLGPMASDKGLEVVLLLHGDLPQTMRGDPGRLAQVVVNLVNNAIKFTPAGQVMVEAWRVETDTGADGVEIAVKDTGIGLDEAEQERVFAALSQGDSSITRRFGVTGLGLSIARRPVGLMGGEIGVQSRKGEGSRFWLRLPCRDCSAPVPIETGGPFAGRRVAVYDANPFARRSLRGALSAWGVQVFNTGRWEQLLEILANGSDGGHLDTVIVGLAREDNDGGRTVTRAEELRARYAGFVLLLCGAENWVPPEPVRVAQPIAWSSKPIRRATLRRLLAAALPAAPVAPDGAVAAGPDAATRRLEGMRVLVAEDNELNRLLLRHLFGRGDPGVAEGAFDDWLRKPIDPAVLIDRLAGLQRSGAAVGAAAALPRRDRDAGRSAAQGRRGAGPARPEGRGRHVRRSLPRRPGAPSDGRPAGRRRGRAAVVAGRAAALLPRARTERLNRRPAPAPAGSRTGSDGGRLSPAAAPPRRSARARRSAAPGRPSGRRSGWPRPGRRCAARPARARRAHGGASPAGTAARRRRRPCSAPVRRPPARHAGGSASRRSAPGTPDSAA